MVYPDAGSKALDRPDFDSFRTSRGAFSSSTLVGALTSATVTSLQMAMTLMELTSNDLDLKLDRRSVLDDFESAR